MENLRTCVVCSRELPESEFWKKDHGQRLDTNCKVCRKEKNMAYRAKNREQVRAKQREWDRAHAKQISESRKKRLQSMSPEDREEFKERQRLASKKMRDERIAAYLAEHGSPPVCECGCGEHVRFSDKGKPNRYVRFHQPTGHHLLVYQENIPRVSLERFRAVFMKMKADKGWTLNQMARKGGISPAHLATIFYDNRKYQRYGLSEEWVRNFLNRLYDRPAPPSTHMLKQQSKIEEAYRSTEPPKLYELPKE